jgi:hypothetical protein
MADKENGMVKTTLVCEFCKKDTHNMTEYWDKRMERYTICENCVNYMEFPVSYATRINGSWELVEVRKNDGHTTRRTHE